MTNLKNAVIKSVHFVGIGGIGISALAQWYLSEGYEVSGTDIIKSDITEMLKGGGVKIFNFQFSISKFQKQKEAIKKYIKNASAIIYSSAVPQNDFQIEYAEKIGKKILSYPEALGELTKKYKTICVSGTHGKSTTTAMLALIMIKAGIDPTVILGTKMRELVAAPALSRIRRCRIRDTAGAARGNNNFRKGKSEWLLIEADEYKAAFLNYSPQMIVLTNIDKDHMDYYKDMSHILDVYSEYIKNLPRDGALIFNGDDENIRKIFAK